MSATSRPPLDEAATRVVIAPRPPRRRSRALARAGSVLDSGPGGILPVAAVLVLWQIGSRAGFIDTTFFPPPSDIAAAFGRLWSDGVITENLRITLGRIGLGFVIGCVPAILVGALMARARWVKRVVDPLIAVTYPIPAIALLPLFLVIFGLGSAPIVAVAAIVSFFPVALNTMEGVAEVDERLVRMAQNAGASRRQLLVKIFLPGALPSIFAGLRLGLGLALLGSVAGEFVASADGIGAQMWKYWQIYQVTNMYACLFVIIVLGFTLTNGMLFVRRRFFAWASAAQRERR